MYCSEEMSHLLCISELCGKLQIDLAEAEHQQQSSIKLHRLLLPHVR